jgi:protein gp37
MSTRQIVIDGDGLDLSDLAGKVSPACTHCYAETMTARLATMPQSPPRYHDGVVQDRRWTGRIGYDSDALRYAFNDLRVARDQRRVFVNSMSDTFHEAVPPRSLRDLAAFIIQHDRCCAAMAKVKVGTATIDDAVKASLTRRDDHVIMLLTKRPDRLLAWQREHFPAGLPAWVWVMTTVEDQARANLRIPFLLQVKAAVDGAPARAGRS